MDKYKIKLINHNNFNNTAKPEYLHVTSRYLENTLLTKAFSPDYTILPHTTNYYDEEEDLHLFMATIWRNRLIKLGVECELVKVDYSQKEN